MQILPANLPRAAATIAMDAMANPATRASRFRSICSRSPTCAHSSRGTGAGGSRRATRFNPARASTRVTVDRGSRNAALICQAVARVRRSVSTAASSDAASRRGCRWGREDPSSSPLAWRDRAIHFATVRTLIPNAAAIRAYVQPCWDRVTINCRIFGVVFALRSNSHSGAPPETLARCGNPHCFQRLPNEQRL